MALYSHKKGRWELKDSDGEGEKETGGNDVSEHQIRSDSQDVCVVQHSESDQDNMLLAKVAEVRAKIRALEKQDGSNGVVHVEIVAQDDIAPMSELQQRRAPVKVWCDTSHAWYHLAIAGDFEGLREDMERQKAQYDAALREVEQLWSLSKPIDAAGDLPVCVNDCGWYSMWGLEGCCQQCWIFNKKGLHNVNVDIIANDIRLSPFSILDHVASESGLMHGDELDACIALLRKRAPQDLFLATIDEWTTMQNHDFVQNLRLIAGARRRIHGAGRNLYPFNVNNAHWELALVDVNICTVYVYDSLRIHADLSKFKRALSAIHDVKDWTVFYPACGKQLDGTSCGLFVVHHMKLLMLGMAVTGGNVPSTGRKSCKRDTQQIRFQVARELLLQRLDDTIVLANVRYEETKPLH